MLSKVLKCGEFDKIVIYLFCLFFWGGFKTNSINNVLKLKVWCSRRVSDLQFMLHHVEGVIGEVDLPNAVDDFLFSLGVNGLLPQLPQLLLWDRWRA